VHYITSISGIGMTNEHLEHVFDEFYKADSSRHDFDSSGLGMPICKRIVERHGGKIWAESKGPGKGSTFYFTIPKKEFIIEQQKKDKDISGEELDQNVVSDYIDEILDKHSNK